MFRSCRAASGSIVHGSVQTRTGARVPASIWYAMVFFLRYGVPECARRPALTARRAAGSVRRHEGYGPLINAGNAITRGKRPMRHASNVDSAALLHLVDLVGEETVRLQLTSCGPCVCRSALCAAVT